MEERKSLSRDGIVFVALPREKGRIVGSPQIVTYGFVDSADAPRLMRDASEVLSNAIEPVARKSLDWNETDRLVRVALGRFFSRRTKRKPLITVTEIDIRPEPVAGR